MPFHSDRQTMSLPTIRSQSSHLRASSSPTRSPLFSAMISSGFHSAGAARVGYFLHPQREVCHPALR